MQDIVMLVAGIFAGAGLGLIAGSWVGIRLANASAERALKALQIDSWNRKNAATQPSPNGRWNRSGQQPGRTNGHSSKAAEAVMLDHDS
jgi:uncharacterized cupin superfamily protein